MGAGAAGSTTARAPGAARAPGPLLADPNPGASRWLLHAVYDLAWLAAIALASPWWLWRSARCARFREMAFGRLGFGLPPARRAGDRARILVHGVSVGEVKGAQALVAELERSHPELEVVISTTTDTGLEVARRIYPRLRVVRFPIDLSPLVRRFLARVEPVCVVLVELEIWPNFLRCANRAGIPLAVVNGRITGESFGKYRLFRHLLPQFNRLTLLCVQDADYARRFAELDADPARILVTGNIKVDGLRTGRIEAGAELARLLGGRTGQRVLVAGSTHEPEEGWLAEAWRAAAPGVRLILVPRHPGRAPSIAQALAALGLRAQRLSALRAGEEPDPSAPAIVDTIGELEQVYALADVVFVGGTLIPHGGQNMLEPAAQGKAVFYGPNLANFLQEAALLEKAGASLRIGGRDDLARELARLLDDASTRARMGAAGIAAVEAQKGATRATLAALLERCLPAGA